MKTIDCILCIDENGNQITSLAEPIPEGTIFVEYVGGKYFWYNEYDELPESYKAPQLVLNMFKRNV